MRLSQSVDVELVRDMMFSSDHLPLALTVSSQAERSQAKQHHQEICQRKQLPLPPIRNWHPNDNRFKAIRQSTLSWQDWEAIPRLHERQVSMRDHMRPGNQTKARARRLARSPQSPKTRAMPTRSTPRNTFLLVENLQPNWRRA